MRQEQKGEFHGYIERVVLAPADDGSCRLAMPENAAVLSAYADQVTSLASAKPVMAICLAVLVRGELRPGGAFLRFVCPILRVNSYLFERVSAELAPPGSAGNGGAT